MIPAESCPQPRYNLDFELDEFLEAFERAAKNGDSDLARHLPATDHPRYLTILGELVRVDLEFAWDRGEERLIEHYRESFPVLFSNQAALKAIALEEYRLRQTAGETPDLLEYQQRFGVCLFEEVGRTLHVQVAEKETDAFCDPERFPRVGDVIPPGLELLSELGRGAFGQVFLAGQADLADRQVAVKISSKLVEESQTLARLQHTNIVPVYSVHRLGRYQALVMPYLGRTTLADLLLTFASGVDRPRSGKVFVDTLIDRVSHTAPSSGKTGFAAHREKSGTTANKGFSQSQFLALAGFSFVEVVLWFGAELADGLAHAHDRGILHRDIKPANILITDDGRPMLLDFNLATEMSALSDPRGVCGTIRYMAPEQLAALRENRGVFSIQTDLYALGLVLVELLTGRLPFEEPTGSIDEVVAKMAGDRSSMRSLPKVPGVSPAVHSILSRCLAPDPQQRYACAEHLREDLRRQLDHRPLRYAPERSWAERIGKWMRRHPRLSSVTTVSFLSILMLVLLGSVLLIRQDRLDQLEFTQAVKHLRSTCENLQVSGLIVDPPPAELLETRSTVQSAVAPFVRENQLAANFQRANRLNPVEQRNLRRDLAEVLFRGAEAETLLTLREVGKEKNRPGLEQATQWNQLAWEIYPGQPPRSFWLQKQRLARLRGIDVDSESEPERFSAEDDSPFESLRKGRYLEARSGLEKLTQQGTTRYGVWMALAICEWRLGNLPSAVDAFSGATGVAPRSPWPVYYRGTVRLAMKRYAEAQRDFTLFLTSREKDPDGFLNRAIARLQLGRYREAIEDLDKAEGFGSTRTRLFILRARARQHLGDQQGATADREIFLKRTPQDALSWAARGETKAAATPPDVQGALKDFSQALKLEPDLLSALRGKASMLTEHLGQLSEGLKLLDRILQLQPDSVEDIAARAVLYARLGRKADARVDAERAAQKAENALTFYQAASAYLIAPATEPDRRRGLQLLRLTLRRDPVWGGFMSRDPDLKVIQADPSFQQLLRGAAQLTATK